MPEKREVIIFSEIETHFDGDARKARAAYRMVCQIGGFGNIGQNYVGGYPPLQLTGLSEAKRDQVDALFVVQKPPAPPAPNSGSNNNQGVNA